MRETEFIYEDGNEELQAPALFGPILIVQAVILILAFIIAYFAKIHLIQELKFSKPALLSLPVALFFIVASGLFYLFRQKIKFMHMDWIIDTLYIPVFGQFTIWQMIIAALISGCCEELLFRGVLMKLMGVYISSIIFGLLHMGHKNLIASGIWIMFMGFILGELYIYTGSLIAPIAAHAINNLASFISLKLLIKKRSA